MCLHVLYNRRAVSSPDDLKNVVEGIKSNIVYQNSAELVFEIDKLLKLRPN
jgi:spore maturation protein CgeB